MRKLTGSTAVSVLLVRFVVVAFAVELASLMPVGSLAKPHAGAIETRPGARAAFSAGFLDNAKTGPRSFGR